MFGSSPTALVNHATWHQRLGHPSSQVMKTMDLPLPDKDHI
jgi:hypothetical protein